MSGAHIRANEVQKTIEPARQPGRELIRQQEQGPVQAVTPQVAYRRVQLNRNGLRPANLLALQRAVGNRGCSACWRKQTTSNRARPLKKTRSARCKPNSPLARPMRL